jgi:PAS domain S-box-containing protein
MILDQTAEISRLRALLRDLFALGAVGDAWVGRDPAVIAAELADVLIESLQLDFAFVRLCDPRGRNLVEVIRGDSWPEIPDWLQQRVTAVGQIARKEIVTNLTGMKNSRRGFIIPVGAQGELGLVAASCDRSDFPNDTDQQLLSVAANNAATAFHNACLIDELGCAEEALRNNEQELRRAHEKLEIKVAERTAELRRSEGELRTLIEIMPAYVGISLPDGSVDFLSQSWLDYSGQTREETMGWGWAGVIHPDDVDRVLANWQVGLASGEPVEQELRCRRADGVYHWFLNRSLPLRDDEGKIVKWYGILFDIDVLKRTETALQMREHELLGIIETIPAMLWSTSPTGEPTHLSHRFLEYRGASFEEFVNRGWEGLHPDDREESAKAFFRAIETGESYNVIHRYRRADGEYRWHHSMGEPLRDTHGKIIQWYGLSIDIDDRKRAEDHLRDMRNKLSTASKIATVAELSASIAHELNQPLMAVLGNAQAAKRWLAANPPDLVETSASIGRILRDIRLADETMQRIRALFKSEPYKKRDESVLDIIRESIRFVHEDPKKHEVQIDWSIEGSLPPICVDRIQTQQVFINLISNAIEATDGSANTARILLRAFVTQEHEVIVQVIDNGTGLEDTERIFDAFMTTKEKGMGIGLAVSRSIVEAHGGRLWAENNPDGDGATFSVALPVSSKREVQLNPRSTISDLEFT